MFLYSLGTIYDLDFKIQQRRNEGNKPITAIRRALQRLWVRPLGLEFTRGLWLPCLFHFDTEQIFISDLSFDYLLPLRAYVSCNLGTLFG